MRILGSVGCAQGRLILLVDRVQQISAQRVHIRLLAIEEGAVGYLYEIVIQLLHMPQLVKLCFDCLLRLLLI